MIFKSTSDNQINTQQREQHRESQSSLSLPPLMISSDEIFITEVVDSILQEQILKTTSQEKCCLLFHCCYLDVLI